MFKKLYSEENNELYHHYNSCICIDIELMTLANRTYELVPEPEGGHPEAQVNLTEVVEDPNSISEDHLTNTA